uniref:Uncharacterized protein n=1 Tax=Cacopsylla melanoneura TaxID=428564 RepID=A0A8D9F8C2_9HEMI
MNSNWFLNWYGTVHSDLLYNVSIDIAYRDWFLNWYDTAYNVSIEIGCWVADVITISIAFTEDASLSWSLAFIFFLVLTNNCCHCHQEDNAHKGLHHFTVAQTEKLQS